MVEYNDYIVFVLGIDNFEISNYIRNNPKRYGVDELYDLCIQIAIDFEDSEYNHDLTISTYDALQQFLEENTLKYMEMYNKGDF